MGWLFLCWRWFLMKRFSWYFGWNRNFVPWRLELGWVCFASKRRGFLVLWDIDGRGLIQSSPRGNVGTPISPASRPPKGLGTWAAGSFLLRMRYGEGWAEGIGEKGQSEDMDSWKIIFSSPFWVYSCQKPGRHVENSRWGCHRFCRMSFGFPTSWTLCKRRQSQTKWRRVWWVCLNYSQNPHADCVGFCRISLSTVFIRWKLKSGASPRSKR